MPRKRQIHRYSAFFKGWAQAFGNHRGGYNEEERLNWLFSEDDDQVGLILNSRLKRVLYKEILGHHETEARLLLQKERIGIGTQEVPTEYRDEEAVRTLLWMMDAPGDLHLYQTYHLFYPHGTRILTLARKAPLPIIYKEIDPLTLIVE